VHARFEDAVSATLPLTAARLGKAGLSREVAAFLHERASASPYLRDVAAELVAWAAKRWTTSAEVPTYLLDLARHELLELDVAAALDDEPPEGLSPDLSLEARLVFQWALGLGRYRHAVHALRAASGPEELPERRDITLLVYRDAEHQVRCLELGPPRGTHRREARGKARHAA
jgi:hypothetical protein